MSEAKAYTADVLREIREQIADATPHEQCLVATIDERDRVIGLLAKCVYEERQVEIDDDPVFDKIIEARDAIDRDPAAREIVEGEG